MKRHGNLFEKIITLENIALAHKKAKKDKSFYKEVEEVDKNPEYHFKIIQEMLVNKTYTIAPDDYIMFTKMDKGKLREIYKLDYFPHRIIQHSLNNIIEEILLSTFISNTFASIPKRGIHLALKRMGGDIVNSSYETQHCLKVDIKKFYPSINQEICSQLFRKKFKDKDLLWLIDTIIFSMDGGKGIAIGSLFSQWAGNFYMTCFDHWMKEENGVKYYYRYCDDIVILHHDKVFLHSLKLKMDNYLSKHLKLKIKDNWQVFPTRVRGVDFIGYRHFGDYVLLRKSTAKTMKRKMSRLLRRCESGYKMSYGEWCSVNSYNGWLKWCNGHNLYRMYIKPLEKYCSEYYIENIYTGKRDRLENNNIKRFSDFAETEDTVLTGKKVKIDEILDEDITIKDFYIGESKFKDGKFLKLSFVRNEEDYIITTGGTILIEQIEKYHKNIPFIAQITKVNEKFYSFK